MVAFNYLRIMTLKGSLIVVGFLMPVACQQEGLEAWPDGSAPPPNAGPRRGPADLSDSSVSFPEVFAPDLGSPDLGRLLAEPSTDGAAMAVDKPVDIHSSPDLSVGDLPSDPVAKAGDEVQPDLSAVKLDASPDLLMTPDLRLLGLGQMCTTGSQCEQGHCSTFTGRCCQSACSDQGCGRGCGTDGLCITCATLGYTCKGTGAQGYCD
jgi:hypothetical protein